jgi:hypothetical protein
VSFSGRVSNVSGKCPSLSFAVNGRQVVTDAATTFAAGPCKDVRDGATVTVTGVQQGSAVYATRVAFNKG